MLSSNNPLLSNISVKPPLFEAIIATPLLKPSNAVKGNGSSHKEGTTKIDADFKIF